MTELSFDFSKEIRPIKPMNAVNNGPAGSKVRGVKGNFADYEAARIPYARNHDASFFSGYGGEHTVDVHRIFKDFDADENDPESYVFGPTDQYVLDTFSAGTKVYYRLGAAIEHGHKYGTYPPKDYLKWAKICEHIIRHYTEGWANGYELDIEYWEIWNEPDCRNGDGSYPCWQGTFEDFRDFFLVSAKYLKETFPNLKIGGPAMASVWSPVDRLMPKFPEHGVYLDFYSYHWYGNDVKMFIQTLERGRKQADEYFGKQAETILNEYNYIRGWSGDDWTYSLNSERGLKGASFNASLMAVSQTSGLLDMLMYYDARPCGMNGMFNQVGYTKLKTYYTISAFSTLNELGTEVASESADDVYSVAATDKNGKGAVLLSYYNEDDNSPEKTVKLSFKGFGKKVKAEYYLLDEGHDMELMREEIFTADEFAAYVKMPLFTTYLIKFEITE
ncbi:MAG: hypothetical protein E7613_10525 [Ruminococcaceae bacterium]|nr:hypothetical protein [Oscillospiraceae bacterium]